MRILMAQINPIVGDLKGNIEKILDSLEMGRESGCEIVVFPELALSGYPPQDLLLHPSFLDDVSSALETVVSQTSQIGALLGLPRRGEGKNLYNSCAVIEKGKLLGFQDKILLPTYDVFDERRYFSSGSQVKLWKLFDQKVGVTICEDIWHHAGAVPRSDYEKDPVVELKKLKPDFVVNLSASPFSVNKPNRRLKVCQSVATSLGCPLVMCNQVGGNDSLIFDGHSFHIDDKGSLVRWGTGFEVENKVVDTLERGTREPFKDQAIESLYRALVLGVRDYFTKQGFKRACIGMSGGIDSSVVACVAVTALGKDHVLGVSMPSRYSSEDSVTDAKELAQNLKIPLMHAGIEGPFSEFLSLLEPHFEGRAPDATEENIQARIRGIILMAISNKLGHILLSTGNKSEMAMGYATLYGDMCGGLSVINDVTKGLVYELARWINREGEVIPQQVIDKPPSAELAPDQKDSDTLPPYELIDNVVQEYMEDCLTAEEIASKHGYDLRGVQDIVKRLHANEYKRRQAPPGFRVTEKAFSVGRRFPIVQKWV